MSADDGVFLESEAERQEYVMNEQGIVYQGVDEYITTTNWDFGQVRISPRFWFRFLFSIFEFDKKKKKKKDYILNYVFRKWKCNTFEYTLP